MKKLIVIAVLSLLLQISGLYILNNFVFVNSSEFKSTKLQLKKDPTKYLNASIPSNAENITLSYDGKYLTYSIEKSLYIEDTKTGKSSEIKTEDNEVIMYHKWLDGRGILTIVEKVKKDGAEKLQLMTYNAANSSKTFVKEICKFKDNMKITNMTTSVLTNVYYIDINKGGSKNVVYRIDRNDDLTQVDIKANILGNMQALQHEDRLIYEDKVDGKFFITSPNEQLKFNSNKKLTLLGVDRNDVVYIGEFNGEKISSILYGKVNENTDTWKKVTLDSPVNRDYLYFNKKSEIVINDNLKGIVKNLTTGKEIEYEGKFAQAKEDFIVTIDNNSKLKYINFDDK